jgi:hypothetical protein
LSSSQAVDRSLQGAEVLGDINRVLLQDGQVDHLQRSNVGGSQYHRRSYARLIGLSPTLRNHTPPITRLQTGKAKLRRWCDQVVADPALVLQEFRGNHCAHQMRGLTRSGAAATIAVEARDRVGTAGLQFGTKDIGLVLHTPSVAFDSSGR